MRWKHSRVVGVVIFIAVCNVVFLISMRQPQTLDPKYAAVYRADRKISPQEGAETTTEDATSTNHHQSLTHRHNAISQGHNGMPQEHSMMSQGHESTSQKHHNVDDVSSELLQKRLPGAIVIGVSKCGTRAILNYLTMHPGVAGDLHTRMPEINYFNNHYDKGVEWYREQMIPSSSPSQLTVEKSPAYFVSSEAPQRIHKFDQSVKLVLVICDPIYRFVSQYVQDLDSTVFKRQKKFPSLDERAIDSNTGDVNKELASIKNGCYYNYIQKWLQSFPLKQIHIVDGESLKLKPMTEMSKLESFLGLDPYFTDDRFYYNSTKGFYCATLENGMAKCLGAEKGRPHPRLLPTAERKLRQYFFKCNKPFFELIKRSWSGREF